MASVLIVDDERPIADSFAAFFERQGTHTVTCAYTGADAIAAYEASRPDLVLLDLRLPDMTGFDVYARIRRHSPVVIMISGHGDIPLAVQALQSGARTFSHETSRARASPAVAAERAFEKVRLRQLNHYLRRASEWRGRIVRLGSLDRRGIWPLRWSCSPRATARRCYCLARPGQERGASRSSFTRIARERPNHSSRSTAPR